MVQIAAKNDLGFDIRSHINIVYSKGQNAHMSDRSDLGVWCTNRRWPALPMVGQSKIRDCFYESVDAPYCAVPLQFVDSAPQCRLSTHEGYFKPYVSRK